MNAAPQSERPGGSDASRSGGAADPGAPPLTYQAWLAWGRARIEAETAKGRNVQDVLDEIQAQADIWKIESLRER